MVLDVDLLSKELNVVDFVQLAICLQGGLLTVSLNLQYQNEKQVAANQSYSSKKFSKIDSSLAEQVFFLHFGIENI